MLKSFYEVRWDNLRLYKVIEDLNRQLEAMREDLAKTREEDKRVFDVNADLNRQLDGLREELKWDRKEEENNLLKYRLKTLGDLHESVTQHTWPHDGSMQKFACKFPFTRIEILPRGEVYTCCSGNLKHDYYLGNIFDEKTDFESIWNGKKAQNLRKSVLYGNYEYCTSQCMFFHQIKHIDRDNENIEETMEKQGIAFTPRSKYAVEIQALCGNSFRMPKGPVDVTLSCDESCNLRCPTCRSKAKALTKEQAEKLYEALMKHVRPMLENCNRFSVLESGEVFASQAVGKFVQSISHADYPKLRMSITTNLQLLDEKKWEDFENLKKIPLDFLVSVDGACKETYEKNRVGAKWERLLHNLELLRKMRAEHETVGHSLCLNMVVQQNNYREIGAFLAFAAKEGADSVMLQRLTNWGTFDDKEFLQRDVSAPSHPEHKAFMEILRNAICQKQDVRVVQNILSV